MVDPFCGSTDRGGIHERQRLPSHRGDRNEQRVLGGRGGDGGRDGRRDRERFARPEVVRQDVTIENGKITSYRVRLGLSFKYDTGD